MSHDATPRDALATANAGAHSAIDDALLDLLEAVTAMDVALMTATWSRFEGLLEAHAVYEEAEIFPRYAALGPHPRGAGPELFDADHVSLRKVTRAAIEALDAIKSSESRRVMVTRLGPLIRIKNILEHHTLREERFLYPRLDEALDSDTIKVLSRGITASASGPCDRS